MPRWLHRFRRRKQLLLLYCCHLYTIRSLNAMKTFLRRWIKTKFILNWENLNSRSLANRFASFLSGHTITVRTMYQKRLVDAERQNWLKQIIDITKLTIHFLQVINRSTFMQTSPTTNRISTKRRTSFIAFPAVISTTLQIAAAIIQRSSMLQMHWTTTTTKDDNNKSLCDILTMSMCLGREHFPFNSTVRYSVDSIARNGFIYFLHSFLLCALVFVV